ncbi:MAG: rhodanese-like domain-containing protein [Algibacter sp.]|uniref:rhodanese-like domain-containing protein n=1 Tax=Algibacter sp. TaxID=1872428 RepID=UPI003296E58D
MNRYFLIRLFVLSMFFACCQSQPNVNAIKLTPKIFQDSLSRGAVQLIDVRTKKEFNSGHINNALNVDFYSDKFKDSLGVLDTNKAVFIYCRSGNRSSKSVAVFKALGFKNVYELEGGITNWEKENYVVNQ